MKSGLKSHVWLSERYSLFGWHIPQTGFETTSGSGPGDEDLVGVFGQPLVALLSPNSGDAFGGREDQSGSDFFPGP